MEADIAASRPAWPSGAAAGRSLIHGLLARSIITITDAIDIVESADSVQVEIAEAADGHGALMWQSHALLTAIANSLKHDGSGSSTPVQLVP